MKILQLFAHEFLEVAFNSQSRVRFPSSPLR